MQTEKHLTGYPSIDKPWLKYYSEEAINAPLPECTIYEYIHQQNNNNLKRLAMNYYGTNMTYAAMFRKIDYMAGVLEGNGVQAGEIVTIAMLNGPDAVCLFLALNKIGAIANMVYGTDPSEELRRHLINSKSQVVFTLDIFQDKFLQIAEEVGLKTIVVTNLTACMSAPTRVIARLVKGMKPLSLPQNKRFQTWNAYFSGSFCSSRTAHNGNAAAVIAYTGGTTGGSKGVVLSNRAITAVTHQAVLRNDVSKSSTLAQIMPLFIAYGMVSSMLLAMGEGITQIIRIPLSESIGEICKKQKPNYIIYSPAYWEKFADDNENLDLSFLRLPTCGGDILRPSVEEKINRYLLSHGCPHPIMNGYGMTEVGSAVCFNFSLKAHRLGSVGVPFVKTIIAAFNPETNEEMKYEQEGEICISTPSLMTGYINDEEETRAVIRRHSDGKLWCHTGDLGYIDKDGFVYISGRIKRFFAHVEGGVHKKIFCVDIEKILLQNPWIENCAVVPVADAETLQVPVAFIVLKQNIPNLNETEKQLHEYANSHLQSAFRPKKYFFVDRFPLTSVGKIDYRKLESVAIRELQKEG